MVSIVTQGMLIEYSRAVRGTSVLAFESVISANDHRPSGQIDISRYCYYNPRAMYGSLSSQ